MEDKYGAYGAYYLRKLANIYEKNVCFEKLTRSDLRLLYEIDKRIYIDDGTGWKITEPLINEIQSNRNVKKDLARLFKCKKNNIATNLSDFKDEEIYIYYGNLAWEDIVLPERFKTIKVIIGDVYFDDIIDSKELQNIKLIVGNVYVYNLGNIDGLYNTTINGSIFLNNITTTNGLEKLNVKEQVYINRLVINDDNDYKRIR